MSFSLISNSINTRREKATGRLGSKLTNVRRFAALIVVCAFVARGGQAARGGVLANFTPGDLVVLRGGDSANSNNLAQPDANGMVNAYLDEYTPAGTYVGTVAVPEMTLSGQEFSSHEGGLNLTANGQYLTFGGYDPVQNPPGPTPHETDGTENDVVMEIGNTASSLATVATIAGASTPNSPTSQTGQYLRAVNSVDGKTGFYVLNKYITSAHSYYVGTGTDNAGLLYVTPGSSASTATVQALQPGTDWRNVVIENNTLYGGTGSSSVGNHDPYLIGSFGTLPTPSNVTVTSATTSLTHADLAGAQTAPTYVQSASNLALLDVLTNDASAQVQNSCNVMYTIGDQSVTGITKWYFNGAEWQNAALQVALAANDVLNPTGLVATIDPINSSWVDIYVSGSNGIYACVDKSCDPATAIPANSFTQIATPQTTDMAFYGMAPAPGPAVPALPQWMKFSPSGSWADSLSWSSSSTPSGVGAAALLWTLGGGTIDLASSRVTLSALSLYSTGTTSYDLIATAHGSFVLQGSGGLPANLVVVGGNQTIAAPITLATSTDVAVDNSRDTLAITGAISGSGALNLSSGSGMLVLSGSDNYSGATTISGGVLQASFGVGLPTATSLTFNGNTAYTGAAILQTSGTIARSLGTGANQVQWTGDGGFAAIGGPLKVTFNGGGTLQWGNLNSSSTGTQYFLPDGSILTFGSPTANNQVNFTNGIDLNGETRQIFVAAGAGGDSALISGDVVDTSAGSTGAVTKTGEGTLILSGINSYGGGTIVENGTLIFGESAAISDGTSLTVGAGGVVIFDPSVANAQAISPAGASLSGGLSTVPEPGTAVLLAIAGLTMGLAGWRRRHRRVT